MSSEEITLSNTNRYILELQQTGMRQIKYRDVADSAINLTIGFLITLIVYFKVMRGEFFTERIPKEVYVYLYCVFVLYHLFRLPKILWTTVYHCLVRVCVCVCVCVYVNRILPLSNTQKKNRYPSSRFTFDFEKR